MTHWEQYQIIAVVNFGVCIGIAWACVCRLNTEVCKKYLRPRARYTVLLAGTIANGAQPLLFGTMPGPGETLFSVAVLFYLLLNVELWIKNDA